MIDYKSPSLKFHNTANRLYLDLKDEILVENKEIFLFRNFFYQNQDDLINDKKKLSNFLLKAGIIFHSSSNIKFQKFFNIPPDNSMRESLLHIIMFDKNIASVEAAAKILAFSQNYKEFDLLNAISTIYDKITNDLLFRTSLNIIGNYFCEKESAQYIRKVMPINKLILGINSFLRRNQYQSSLIYESITFLFYRFCYFSHTNEEARQVFIFLSDINYFFANQSKSIEYLIWTFIKMIQNHTFPVDLFEQYHYSDDLSNMILSFNQTKSRCSLLLTGFLIQEKLIHDLFDVDFFFIIIYNKRNDPIIVNIAFWCISLISNIDGFHYLIESPYWHMLIKIYESSIMSTKNEIANFIINIMAYSVFSYEVFLSEDLILLYIDVMMSGMTPTVFNLCQYLYGIIKGFIETEPLETTRPVIEFFIENDFCTALEQLCENDESFNEYLALFQNLFGEIL